MDLTQEGNQPPLERFNSRPIWMAFAHLFVRREIVHCLPFVRPWADVCRLHLRQELLIPVSHCSESNIGACFDNWLGLGVEHDAAVGTVAHAQLLAEDNEVAV